MPTNDLPVVSCGTDATRAFSPRRSATPNSRVAGVGRGLKPGRSPVKRTHGVRHGHMIKGLGLVSAFSRPAPEPGLQCPWWLGQGWEHRKNCASRNLLSLRPPAPARIPNRSGKVVFAFESHYQAHRSDAVLVVDEVNAPLGCSIVAKKLCIPVAHVKAGWRIRNIAIREEIDRLVTDSVSDWLFVSESSGVEHLRAPETRKKTPIR